MSSAGRAYARGPSWRALSPVGPARSLWRHRELIRQLVIRDLQQRYRGSYLGILWFAVQRHPPDRWVSLGLGAAGSMAGGAALWWFLSLTATDRSFWTSRLRILLRS